MVKQNHSMHGRLIATTQLDIRTHLSNEIYLAIHMVELRQTLNNCDDMVLL